MVTLLGGGNLAAETVSDLLTIAPNLVCCDGAAGRALALGHMPDAVIGDLDSLDPEARAQLDPARVHFVDDQDTTDFDKALLAIDAPLILGAGFMGKRLDHELACYNALVRWSRRCILVGDHDICFHAPRSVRLDLPEGTRVSVFPMAERVVNLRGLAWSHENLTLSPMGRVGTSNAAAGVVEIESSGPGLLIILPVAHLGAAIEAVLAMPEPSRAG
ncbi:MAG: thiamine diphosphokinase [Pseudomonadota bacterium]|nr:thiamine diphosphokinase [Pseudomonadota bacterium]